MLYSNKIMTASEIIKYLKKCEDKDELKYYTSDLRKTVRDCALLALKRLDAKS